MGNEMNNEKCFFCGIEDQDMKGLGKEGASETYNCPNCGPYGVSYKAISNFSGNKEEDMIKSSIAGYLYETNKNSEKLLTITSQEMENILKSEIIPRTIIQKLEKLLLHLYKSNSYIGQKCEFNILNAGSLIQLAS